MVKVNIVPALLAALFVVCTVQAGPLDTVSGEGVQMFDMAMQNRDVHVFSTLFTAQDVDKHLSSDEGREFAINWCKENGITRVFIETYRSRHEPTRELLVKARDQFRANGIAASGCVTTTIIGKIAEHEGIRIHDSCYSSKLTQSELARVFSKTAEFFDEIMIDDFLFTKCECELCTANKGERPWSEFRTDLMVQISKDYILAPAKAANKNVKVIIKYPNWYDGLQDVGYDAARQTELYDLIWTGTETRGPDNLAWGGYGQYAGFFIMQWLNQVGQGKNSGGWYDEISTTDKVYVEQARQTVLGQAKESMLFHYGSLIHGDGANNIGVLRDEMPQLYELARLIAGKKIRGTILPKPTNSEHDGDLRVMDYPGMLGIACVPMAEVPESADSIFLAYQALRNPGSIENIQKMIDAKTPMVVTCNLAAELEGRINLNKPWIKVLDYETPRDLYDIDATRLQEIRKLLLEPTGMSFEGPTMVATYPFGDDLLVVENFNDEPVNVKISITGSRNQQVKMVIPRQARVEMDHDGEKMMMAISPRSLVVIGYD